MALGATIHRLAMAIADIDRGYYADHTLRVARHPSETDERMMVRVLAFALNAAPALAFGAGLSTEDAPDLLLTADDGRILHWIVVGLPDPKWLRKAASRAERVTLYAYGNGQAIWWRRHADELVRTARLAIAALPVEASSGLARLAERTMTLNVTVQDGQAWIDDGRQSLAIDWTWLRPGDGDGQD